MNAVLGGQFVSRVNLKLREEKGYTYGARTELRLAARHLTVCAADQRAHGVDRRCDCRLSGRDISACWAAGRRATQEMSLAKASLTRGYPRGFETAQQVARSVAMLSLYGLPDTYFEEFVPKVERRHGRGRRGCGGPASRSLAAHHARGWRLLCHCRVAAAPESRRTAAARSRVLVRLSAFRFRLWLASASSDHSLQRRPKAQSQSPVCTCVLG